MNILFVVPYAPNRIRTRPYNFIRNLSKRGHSITLATLWENEQERTELQGLGQNGIKVVSTHLTKVRSAWNTLVALPTNVPLQAVYCWQPKLLRLIDSQLSEAHFDVIHVEHLRGVHYGLWLKSHLRKSNLQTPIVWDSVDCISYLFEQAARSSRSLFGRLVTRLELNRTRRYEGWLVGQFDRVLATSPIDQSALERLVGEYNQSKNIPKVSSENITVLPNGVDLGYFHPTDEPRESATLVFSGKMSYHANITAALYLVNDVMPLIWAERPNVRLWIVGKDPSVAIRRLADRNPKRVFVTGTVPDIRPYLSRASVAVCPVRYGAGIQNKVLEAMAMATPVVATPQAVSALRTCDDEYVLVGNATEAFASTVMRALKDGKLRQKIGQTGRQYVETHHDWTTITRDLEALYNGQLWKTTL
jgi:polysaccharide biosynthesis protein PslH